MSLRKSPQLTPALLAAARQNAQHSTGPRSAAAKQNSKLNALKHGVPPRRDQRRKSTPSHAGAGRRPGRIPKPPEDLKMNEQYGNTIENKGTGSDS